MRPTDRLRDTLPPATAAVTIGAPGRGERVAATLTVVLIASIALVILGIVAAG